MTPYDEAHLFVAAARVLFHQKQSSPPIEDICNLIDISTESGHALCRKLEKLGIVELFEDPFSLKVAVANHLEIEKLPRKEESGNLAKELEQFMAKKKNMDKKVESIQAELETKKKSMFSDIEQKLKKNMRNNNS
jgi:hypothetical protein